MKQSITIIGRRWFERVNGNTYHSVSILVDGKHVHRIEYDYGYGRMYAQNAQKWLDKNGYLPGIEHYPNGGSESLWRYCEKNGIALFDTVTDVKRKKDL